MTTKLRASLEATIQRWLDETCEDEGVPDGVQSRDLAVHMASAAVAVYDVMFAVQEEMG